MAKDVDTEWYEKHGHAEQPHDFNRRWQQNQLTDEEKALTQDCTAVDQAFSVIYPDYVSLDQFRQDAWKQPEQPATPEITEPAE